MYLEEIKNIIYGIPELVAFPQAKEFIEGLQETDKLSPHDYSFIACNAGGGTDDTCLHVAAANFTSLLAIHLIDDILDKEQEAFYVRHGAGTTANLAQALTAASLSLLAAYDDDFVYKKLNGHFNKMILQTCLAQELDQIKPRNEQEYWKIISAKTPPLFSTAIYAGVLVATRNADLATMASALGTPFGKIVQLNDDLVDAFKPGGTPDWISRTDNLAILYAMTADHKYKDRFIELLDDITNPSNLKEAQAILFQSGAVSYCMYHLLELEKEVSRSIDAIDFKKPKKMHELRQQLMQPVYDMIESAQQN